MEVVANCDFKLACSCEVNRNIKSSEKRFLFLLTCSLRRPVSTPYNLAKSLSRMTLWPRIKRMRFSILSIGIISVFFVAIAISVQSGGKFGLSLCQFVAFSYIRAMRNSLSSVKAGVIICKPMGRWSGLKPQGINLGMNLGKVSGAGVAGHIHLHIVPRWQGDANFMPVLAETKLISVGLSKTYRLLKKELQRIDKKHSKRRSVGRRLVLSEVKGRRT